MTDVREQRTFIAEQASRAAAALETANARDLYEVSAASARRTGWLDRLVAGRLERAADEQVV